MSEHLYTQRKTSDRSASTPQHSPFQPHPFVVQPQTEEQSEQPDLKTALERAKRYGHNLDRIKFGAPPVQPKLTIGQPGDKYEQEADKVAAQVVNSIHTPTTQQSESNQAVQRQEEREEEIQAKPEITALQRQEESEEEIQAKPGISDLGRSPLPSNVQREAMPEDEELQTKSILQRREAIRGGEASTDVESAINSAKGGGQPLEAGLQQSMGQAMGADFSGVKIHTDAHADRLHRSVQARAFTTGQDVFFRQGEYNPGSRGGQELLAHELTHVVQQAGGQAKHKKALTKSAEQSSQIKIPTTNAIQRDGNTSNTTSIASTAIGGLATLTFGWICYSLTNDSRIRQEEYTKVIAEIPNVAKEIFASAENAKDSGQEVDSELMKWVAQGALLARNQQMETVRGKISTIGSTLSAFMKSQGKTYEELYQKYSKDGASEDLVNQRIISAAGRANRNLVGKFLGL